MSSFDQTAVRAMYANDPIARVVLDHVANRARSVNAISADSVLELCAAMPVSVTREMAVTSMRALADAGAGAFLCGRRGKVSRLRFALTSKIVGAVAKGLHDIPTDTTTMEATAPAAEVLPMARKDDRKSAGSAGLNLGQVRELLAGSSVEDLRRVATYIGKILELSEMEAGNFDVPRRRATDRAEARN